MITTLESAVFEHCDFRDAKFDGVTLRSARFEHCDLRGVEGLVVDDNVLRGTLMSPKATDAWSQMRRTYTGANMVFILLASVIFFCPGSRKAVSGLASIAWRRVSRCWWT
ncbi:MAG: pentapeptide repeat-containing protein [Gammaproteobacteria bacterium]|nr:pentapeptide repeat-containing protein [Gammaproteobacteria bacterium]